MDSRKAVILAMLLLTMFTPVQLMATKTRPTKPSVTHILWPRAARGLIAHKIHIWENQFHQPDSRNGFWRRGAGKVTQGESANDAEKCGDFGVVKRLWVFPCSGKNCGIFGTGVTDCVKLGMEYLPLRTLHMLWQARASWIKSGRITLTERESVSFSITVDFDDAAAVLASVEKGLLRFKAGEIADEDTRTRAGRFNVPWSILILTARIMPNSPMARQGGD